MTEQLRRIFTAILLLGPPGSGKTSLIATLASYVWETHHKVTCLYSWDGGAIPTRVQALMRHGLIRFFRARTRSAAGLQLETPYLATKGYWPAQINPETGEVTPAVDMVPPVTTSYTVSCGKTGQPLAVLPVRGAVGPTYCSACKTLHALPELTVVEAVIRTPGFEQVGAVAFDGLTSMCDVVLEHMDQQRGAGAIGGEKSSFGGVVQSGSVKWGGNNRADIGFGQSRALQFVNNSLSIPYIVEGPVFTALSKEATDEGGLPIVGAQLPGNAATASASSWAGNVMEMGQAEDEQGRPHHALYLQPYTDKQNRRHLLKSSASPGGVPPVLVDPIGQPWAQANLGLVLTLLDQDLQKAVAEAIEGAPGLEGTPSSFGTRFSQPPAPSLSTSPAAAPAAVATPPAPVASSSPGTPGAAASPGVTPPVAAPALPPTLRRRTRAEPPAAALTGPPVGPPGAVPSSLGPPPPPGMKPPQRVPVEPVTEPVTQKENPHGQPE